MEPNVSQDILKGGEFLVKETTYQDVFTPEDFSEDQLMIRATIKDFIKNRVQPNLAQLEKLDIELTKQLLKEMGDLGILGIPFPEKYGGSEMDFVTNLILSEMIAETLSFSLSFGAHTSIGMLPILYFGTEDQKQKYLPELIAGTKYAAYCLTEPGSGSDALAAKTAAVLSEDGGHYIMNGQKMWITNAGFADVFTVFAKIDGQHFTGFIVEREWEGISFGEEEKKMGIKGSSTRQVFFENVKVPVENVLGEKGRGHVIAFNILNIGRIKLGASVVGGSKLVNTFAIRYAKERKQFKKSLSEFGAIQYKLAEQAIRAYANDAALYRASYNIKQKEEALLAQGKAHGEALLGGAEEYSIECAMLKVTCSECLDYAVDEGVQIYGGMGYSEEAPMAAAYRDARINRIFEGTNEINRLLAVDMLMKKVMKGGIDMMTPAMQAQQELMAKTNGENAADEKLFDREKKIIANLKKAFVVVAGATAQHFMQGLETEQEIIMNISDMMADIYIAESVLLRTEKYYNRNGESATKERIAMTQVFIDDAIERFAFNGKRTIASWAKGEMNKNLNYALHKFTKYKPVNAKNARRLVAAKLIKEEAYCF